MPSFYFYKLAEGGIFGSLLGRL
jgi:hypothetical protein